jgi:hypothetical protein
LRVKAAVTAARLWERILNDRDRQKLDGDLKQSFGRLGTVGMWMKLRGVSQRRAIVEVAQTLGFLDPPTYQWLSRAIGIKPSARTPPDRPDWDTGLGDLRLDGGGGRFPSIRESARASLELPAEKRFHATGGRLRACRNCEILSGSGQPRVRPIPQSGG